ncbi:MAG TPA: gamma-glutamyl-gamma-aminobutyrate hydrolase family protein [Verrucomicrobiae bacterium]|nr:gamma-glutamyl-gamma-aminobutyrate hydrolase family protein [Verrucomicrobiae bacterium]
MKPVIAITPEAITLRSRMDGRGSFCGVSYSEAIELAGGVPLIVPLTRDKTLLDHFLKTCDGWLLTGGGDVAAKFYAPRMSATLRKKISGADEVRDEMEIYVARKLRERDQPLFGICRGIQVMNVAFGGTLLPHIAGHRNPQPDAFAHKIEWTKRGTLNRAMDGFDRVNTSHHQVLDRVAPGFEVVARAPDGVIEAMEKPDARFCCGVQFHPERLVKRAPQFQKLFREFVKACRGRDA